VLHTISITYYSYEDPNR